MKQQYLVRGRQPLCCWRVIAGGDNDASLRPLVGYACDNLRQPTVRLAPRLLAHLRRWKRLDGGRGYVVTYAGLPIASAKTGLARACALAGIEGGVTAYTLRHTAASWLVAEGPPTRKVADFLGASEGMILDHYGHLAPDYQDEAAQAIGRGGRQTVG